MGLELLDEALEYDLGPSIAELIGPASAALYIKTKDAARAYRDLLADGERVDYCEEHKSSFVLWGGMCGHPQRFDTPCRIVSRLLIDYPKEAENE